jgi:hypothetical protein
VSYYRSTVNYDQYGKLYNSTSKQLTMLHSFDLSLKSEDEVGWILDENKQMIEVELKEE